MQRATFVTLSNKGDDLLRLLQRLGVVHPEHINEEAILPSIERLRHKLNMQQAVINDLKALSTSNPSEKGEGSEPSFTETEAWFASLRDLEEKIKSHKRMAERLQPWGDYDPKEVKKLFDEGIFIQLWSADAYQFDDLNIPDGIFCKIIEQTKSEVLFVTVKRGGIIRIEGAEAIALSENRLTVVQEELDNLEAKRSALVERLERAASHLPHLMRKHARDEHEYYYQEAIQRAFDDGDIKAFAGWLPKDHAQEVKDVLTGFATPVVMDVRDPLPDENPPVFTKNIFLSRVFEPLLRLFGIPDYRGLDPALFFAPFMMLFFGICLGDVGYGIAMMAGAYAVKRIFKGHPFAKVVGNLTFFFGIATMLVGVVTGSVFGTAPGGREWILLDVSYDFGDPMLLFKISIALGFLHLTIAFVLSAIAAHHWQIKICKLGSICILWGGALLVLGISFWWMLLAVGIGIVLIFTSDASNPFKRLGLGLWGIYNHTTLVGDVMSYSRLFGLGIATAAIATVVNELSAQASSAISIPILGAFVGIVVLVVGHTFNMTIGIISALVHPARLHAVEALPKFVQFTGVQYKPLATD
ncbi:MAG: V-type ATPase 116kDa subunit family protein [Pseudomonadota bacterium]